MNTKQTKLIIILMAAMTAWISPALLSAGTITLGDPIIQPQYVQICQWGGCGPTGGGVELTWLSPNPGAGVNQGVVTFTWSPAPEGITVDQVDLRFSGGGQFTGTGVESGFGILYRTWLVPAGIAGQDDLLEQVRVSITGALVWGDGDPHTPTPEAGGGWLVGLGMVGMLLVRGRLAGLAELAMWRQ